jgi:hypothetical protein
MKIKVQIWRGSVQQISHEMAGGTQNLLFFLEISLLFGLDAAY